MTFGIYLNCHSHLIFFNLSSHVQANKHSNPVQIVAFIPLQVPATVILSNWLLGQNDWQPRDLVGCICVMLGLACVSWAQYKSSQEAASEAQDAASFAGMTGVHDEPLLAAAAASTTMATTTMTTDRASV